MFLLRLWVKHFFGEYSRAWCTHMASRYWKQPLLTFPDQHLLVLRQFKAVVTSSGA
jgi:hypothetical protein